MIHYKEIQDKITSKELNSDETKAYKAIDNLIDKKIQDEFFKSNTLYIKASDINKFFEDNNVLSKRRGIIISQMMFECNKKGWLFEFDNTSNGDVDYYIIMPLKS